MGRILEAIDRHRTLLEQTSNTLGPIIEEAGNLLAEIYRRGGKVLLFGNGGSASDALHMEGELLGRFRIDREGLPAIALGGGVSALTAVSNDYAYEDAFARMVRAHARSEDAVLLFSTSGTSENLIRAARAAAAKGAKIVALTGRTGGGLKEHADLLLNVPGEETARIQEMHILIIHLLCDEVEQALFGTPP
jgi:D-sedoheptulose 7-phosphate isomerase